MDYIIRDNFVIADYIDMRGSRSRPRSPSPDIGEDIVQFIDDARVVRIVMNGHEIYEGDVEDAMGAMNFTKILQKSYARFLIEANDTVTSIAAGILRDQADDIELNQRFNVERHEREQTAAAEARRKGMSPEEEEEDREKLERTFARLRADESEKRHLEALKKAQEETFMKQKVKERSMEKAAERELGSTFKEERGAWGSDEGEYESEYEGEPEPSATSTTTPARPIYVKASVSTEPKRHGVYELGVKVISSVKAIANANKEEIVEIATQYVELAIEEIHLPKFQMLDPAVIVNAFVSVFMETVVEPTSTSAPSPLAGTSPGSLDELSRSGRELLHVADTKGGSGDLMQAVRMMIDVQDRNTTRMLAEVNAQVTRLADKSDLARMGISRNADLIGITAIAYEITANKNILEVDRKSVFYTLRDVRAGRMSVADALKKLQLMRGRKVGTKFNTKVGNAQWDLANWMKKERMD